MAKVRIHSCKGNILDRERTEDEQSAIDANPPPTSDEQAISAVDGKDRLLFEVNFQQENRLRALEGKAAITKAQYRDALIALWKSLNQ